MSKATATHSDCCIVIATYNAERWIKTCLDSALSSDYKAEIIVVDNDSKDQTVSIIKESFSQVHLIASGENLGFGKANNKGIEYGMVRGYRYFFLLNQDAYLEPNSLGYLIQTINENPTAGIVSPVHLTGRGDGLDHGFKSGIKSPDFVRQFENQKWSKDGFDVPFVNAAGWLLSREAILKIGLFHPLFFHYGEDKNYVARVKHLRYRLLVDRRAFIRHDREDRGYNPLKEDPYKNHERKAWQILLAPKNPSSYLLLLGMALYNMGVVISKSRVKNKRAFIRKNTAAFKEKYKAVKKFGGRNYNPFAGKSQMAD